MIIDITRPIYQGMPVYPGGPETIFKRIGQLPKDRSVSTKITIGSHTGTHVDAPNHVIAGADGIDSYPLERFMGKAVVLDVSHIESVVTDKVISSAARNLDKESRIKNLELRIENDDPMIRNSKSMIQIEGKIILIKTKNSALGWVTFHEDFVALDESAARYLVSFKPKLIGIDGPSIKKFRVPDQSHQIILSQNIPIIEWLDLTKVEEGIYQFIGFPLHLKDIDSSPIRAVLIV